ncbi:MAG TPA: glycosyltransferase family 2 protein [Thermoanaerobaculia bacterium]|nr:glycosyltransferase family 2 protein [Thermoanaerobaculia bacterium]
MSAVIPTLGRSPLLLPCLEALRRDGGEELEILVVDQGESALDLPPGLADRVLRPGRNLGFTGGTNAGIAAAAGDRIATVNDDLIVEPGWLGTLAEALDWQPRAAAVQGVNLSLAEPGTVDGVGLAWNRAWQAVQIGHGEPAPPTSPMAEPPREVFGVSATAALYRREALEVVALPKRGIFDQRLGSYYEDADLACRLRSAGWTAWSIPAARAGHAGSTTGGSRPRERWASLYGNRLLVLARLLGSAFWLRLPAVLARDLVDLLKALAGGDGARVTGIVVGWARALRLFSAFARRGGPIVPMSQIERFR